MSEKLIPTHWWWADAMPPCRGLVVSAGTFKPHEPLRVLASELRTPPITSALDREIRSILKKRSSAET